MKNGYIKIHRKVIDWEWYKDLNTFRLFLHLLLKANYKPKQWQGKTIERGSFVTGRFALSKETGLSEQQIRTCLNKLKSTNEITIQATNRNTLVSIVKYDDYQHIEQEVTNEITIQTPNKQPTSNQQVTTTKKLKKEKNVNKEMATPIFNFKGEILALGIDEQIVSDWMTARKKKKAVNTKTAFDAILTQINKSGLTPQQAIKTAASNGWAGFQAEWLNKTSYNSNQTKELNWDSTGWSQ